MLDYIDKMETLLRLPSPKLEKSLLLYEKALDSIDIETNENEPEFRDWVKNLFTTLSKNPLGTIIIEEWIRECKKRSLRPTVKIGKKITRFSPKTFF